MSARAGVLSAGSFCVDFNKSIARWPEQDTVTEVLRIDRQGGGSGYNMAVDLKRLDPAFPVEAMGVVGDDDLGRFLIGECRGLGIACDRLQALPGGATMSVDAINVRDTGRRTHFFHPGVAAAMNPDHFDFSTSKARFLHLGLPGAHAAMDVAWGDEANGWVAVLRKARAAGLATNLELMTTSAERLAELGRPCLAHLDFLIVNDFEIGALAGIATRRDDGSTDVAAVGRAIARALELGAMRWVVAHFPEGAALGGRDGERVALGSVAMPATAIAGVNGAGDAFAAGMIHGLHQGWPVVECLRLAHGVAAASMRAVSTTEGVAPVAECLALVDRWGLRPAPA
ncbi:sugar/nucleoside kinase (ribokinase family) [Roseiarcus fermentans]|uniref:Sugar/nucleoside kinase (Ribokinase family) n=1 Tax=Roseiarcus fermentans TaxID=1473586 RepID=A0A366FIM6_9HYPH|nr:carbohydrate kinase family protein [Roseiarcus fermentans]RBP14437.1 sugar/nucleoside kinase (ribokinase family) [Roseiarcus fermentans]